MYRVTFFIFMQTLNTLKICMKMKKMISSLKARTNNTKLLLLQWMKTNQPITKIETMNAKQFGQAVAMARNTDLDLTKYDTQQLYGFGLPDFEQVHVALGEAAACIRWQCLMLNGDWDQLAMEECKTHFRHKVMILDENDQPTTTTTV